jgi:hypothetical protein
LVKAGNVGRKEFLNLHILMLKKRIDENERENDRK